MFNKGTLKELVKSKLGEALFVVATNREPYMHVYKEDKVEVIRPASGVAIALGLGLKDSVSRGLQK